MSPCLSPTRTLPLSHWALLQSLRTVLVVGARSTELEARAQVLRKGGFTPALAHTGEAALQRLVEEPIPALLLLHGAGPAAAQLLAELRSAGMLGWFSLVVVDTGEGEWPADLRVQARVASDCSPAQLLAALEQLAS